MAVWEEDVVHCGHKLGEELGRRYGATPISEAKEYLERLGTFIITKVRSRSGGPTRTAARSVLAGVAPDAPSPLPPTTAEN